MAEEETPTALPEHADFAIVANPSADLPYTVEATCTPTAPQEYADFFTVVNPSGDQPYTAGPTCTPTPPQEYADSATVFSPSGHQSCTAGPSDLVNKATPTARQELAAAETSPEPPNVENSLLTCEAVLPSIQTEVMEVDDLSGCPSHNSVSPASDKVINLF